MIVLNGKEVVFKQFPNGELQLDGEQVYSNLSMFTNNVVLFKYENDSDLIKLMVLKRYIDEEKTAPTVLLITYMPYSRMDRQESDSVFTLKYIADFINQMNFHTVYVHEPHSDVTPALLNNCIAIDLTTNILERVMDEIGFDKEKDFVFYMDAVDQKKYNKKVDCRSLVGFKDEEDLKIIGQISLFRKVVILTDLCDKGEDFVQVAEKLKHMGAGEIYLVAGHCEDTIFEGPIPSSAFIEKVFTTDSIISESEHDKVEIAIQLGGTVNVDKAN